MPLDRTWYNTLIDDNGSGLTGSVWDKADVDALMDAVDAQLPTAGAWTPSLIGTSGGTAAYVEQSGLWTRSGSAGGIVSFSGRITLSSKGTLAGTLLIDGFPFYSRAGTLQVGTFAYWIGLQTTVAWIGLYIQAGEYFWRPTYVPAPPTGATGVLTPAQLGAGTVDLVFGGTVSVA